MSAPRADDILEVHVARSLRLQKHVYTWVFADFGLETFEYHALVHLAEAQGVNQVELGTRLLRDKVATSRLLVELEKKGLVERRDDPHDSRAKRVFLTAPGRRLLARARAAHAAVAERVCRALSRREQATLVALLGKLQEGYRDACRRLEIPAPEVSS